MTMKKIGNIFYWIVFAAIAFYLAYSKGWIFSDFESISPKQAYSLMQKDQNTSLLDVRTPEEFSEEHIEGAILIPVQELKDNLTKLQGAKDKKIIVYCHSGNRSITAARILVSNGFFPLSVRGGIEQWKSEGFPVVR